MLSMLITVQSANCYSAIILLLLCLKENDQVTGINNFCQILTHRKYLHFRLEIIAFKSKSNLLYMTT